MSIGKTSGFASEKPVVLFVCTHNAGRSQMAAGFMRKLCAGAVQVLSAGVEPKEQITPIVIDVMREEGIDIVSEVPKILAIDTVKVADMVITMGCGDACPVYPGKRYEDWDLPDPVGRSVDEVRLIRDDIKHRVQKLLTEISSAEA